MHRLWADNERMAWVTDANAVLLTDFYELTMLEAYFQSGANDIAVFDLCVRRLPPVRQYLIACGLDHVLSYLETLSFSPNAIAYLGSLGKFTKPFLDSLRNFRFTGDVYAVPEGTVIFPDEPILEVVAPLPQAQIIETFVMNQIQLATMAASKASRVVFAAQQRPVIDFGLRRTHGTDAGMKAARAFYIAGISATSNVLAGQVFGIPVSGTMAHSYIQSFENEVEAFRSFLHTYPDAILLVDTYDTLRGVQRVIDLSRELRQECQVSGIRLDSGDLLHLAQQSRRLLNESGFENIKIYASSDLDEYAIDRLLQSGAPLDGFGVGTRMATSSDAPYLDMAYKLVEYAGRHTMKLSEHKRTLPGRKQVFRERRGAKFAGDVIAVASEKVEGEPLLIKFMENGRRLRSPETLEECRSRCKSELNHLPEVQRGLSESQSAYPVVVSPELRSATLRLESTLGV
jgi:nicotinate phosphoribosyltransferase